MAHFVNEPQDDFPTDEQISVWPNCIVADCQNKSCLRLNSDKCWPHTVGFRGISGAVLSDYECEELERKWLESLRGENNGGQ